MRSLERAPLTFAAALLASAVAASAEAAEPASLPARPAPPPAPAQGATRADAHAPKGIVVWPTFTPAGDDSGSNALHRPTSLDEPLATHAHELDATLRDAAQDLGFVLDLDDPGPQAGHLRDVDLLARARRTRPLEATSSGTWVVSARLEAMGNDSFMLRIVAVPPNGKELRTRVEIVKGPDISLRGLVLLRDLLSPDHTPPDGPSAHDSGRDESLALASIATPARSPGRPVLAVNGALFGGYLGYSLVRSTGTSDPRVLYPLLTLGSAVGLGGALLAAEEWDVGTGDAWFLSAGAWWGAASGILLANSNTGQAEGPYAWGIGGGLTGIALGTFALTRTKMDEGDALLTHSGAGLGMWLGALVDLGYRGTTNATPYTGAGLGSAIGLAGAGAASIFVTVAPSRVLLLDLGAGLGSLAGAAVCSPLIFSSLTGATTSPTNTRLFLAGTFAGTAVGGTAAWFFTRGGSPKTASWLNAMPSAGLIGQSMTSTGSVPAYGVMATGTF